MSRVEVTPIMPCEPPALDKCWSLWGKNTCPNAPAFLVVNTVTGGFAVMCEPHCAGFSKDWTGPMAVEPYTPERAQALWHRVLRIKDYLRREGLEGR